MTGLDDCLTPFAVVLNVLGEPCEAVFAVAYQRAGLGFFQTCNSQTPIYKSRVVVLGRVLKLTQVHVSTRGTFQSHVSDAGLGLCLRKCQLATLMTSHVRTSWTRCSSHSNVHVVNVICNYFSCVNAKRPFASKRIGLSVLRALFYRSRIDALGKVECRIRQVEAPHRTRDKRGGLS